MKPVLAYVVKIDPASGSERVCPILTCVDVPHVIPSVNLRREWVPILDPESISAHPQQVLEDVCGVLYPLCQKPNLMSGVTLGDVDGNGVYDGLVLLPEDVEQPATYLPILSVVP